MESSFNLYNEPIAFQWLVFIFNSFVYGGLWFSALHIFRLALFDKMKIVLSNWTILGVSAIAIALNIYFKLYIEIWGFIFIYSLASWASWKWIDRKSLRWTNISLGIFFLFTLGMYNFFNTKIQSITYSFFSFNDIVEYSFIFKPYFEIYLPGGNLATTKILIEGNWLTQGTAPVHFRIYLFYYFMQSIAITFWLFIFFDVLKKHAFFYKKQVEKMNTYMFYYAQEDFKWKNFKNKNARELFLINKKKENKKLKSGELVKVITSKNDSRNKSEKKESEIYLQESDYQESLDARKFLANINIEDEKPLIYTETKEIKFITKKGEDNVNNEKLKNELIKQANDLQRKSKELLEMANNLDDTGEKNSSLELEKNKIEALHERLINNRVFTKILNINDLKIFMEWHVFAVWDFMSLTKRLQRDLTCVSLPWVPSKNANAAHLINSIVLGEETDKTLIKGEKLSHFELYIRAMKEIDADTTQIQTFIKLINDGEAYSEALKIVDAPKAVQKFTNFTIETAINGSTEEVLGSFFFGRENVIPDMFKNLLENLNIGSNTTPTLHYYLNRHIELDQGDHGPAAQALIDNLFPLKEQKSKVYYSAQQAIQERINLWNALILEVKK